MSLIMYRAFFNPLNRLPGPFGARISNFWFSVQLLRKQDSHKKLLALHETYGDVVRIGASDLSITNPRAVHKIYGLGSNCTKADWYDLTFPMISMQTARQKSVHDQRRRIWSGAFSDKALRGYEERIRPFQAQLMEQLEAFSQKPVNVTKWFSLYSFDVMGDLAFGSSFKMLESSEEHWAIKLLTDGMVALGWMFPTWFFRLLTAIPGASRDWWRFISFCCQKLNERMNVTMTSPLCFRLC